MAATDTNYAVVHDHTLNLSALNGVLANDLDSDGDTLTASLSR